jgi:hypothetical protein
MKENQHQQQGVQTIVRAVFQPFSKEYSTFDLPCRGTTRFDESKFSQVNHSKKSQAAFLWNKKTGPGMS